MIESGVVTKSEIIVRIAGATGWSKATSHRAVNAMLDGIKAALRRGEPVTLVGFGTFSATRRKPRTIRNPRTGRTVSARGGRAPRFRPSRELKQAVR